MFITANIIFGILIALTGGVITFLVNWLKQVDKRCDNLEKMINNSILEMKQAENDLRTNYTDKFRDLQDEVIETRHTIVNEIGKVLLQQEKDFVRKADCVNCSGDE